MDIKELLGQFSGAQPAFNPTASIEITRHVEILGKGYDVTKSFSRGYYYAEEKIPAGDNAVRTRYSTGGSTNVSVIDENGKNIIYSDRSTTFIAQTSTDAYPPAEEVHARFRELDHQEMTKFLSENPVHAEAAKAYGSPEEYFRSTDYANLAAKPVKIQGGKLSITPDSSYGIDFPEGHESISFDYNIMSDGSIKLDGDYGDMDIAEQLQESPEFQQAFSDKFMAENGSVISQNADIINSQFNGNVNAFLNPELNPDIMEYRLNSSDRLGLVEIDTQKGISGRLELTWDGKITPSADIPAGISEEEAMQIQQDFVSSPEVQSQMQELGNAYRNAKQDVLGRETAAPEHEPMENAERPAEAIAAEQTTAEPPAQDMAQPEMAMPSEPSAPQFDFTSHEILDSHTVTLENGVSGKVNIHLDGTSSIQIDNYGNTFAGLNAPERMQAQMDIMEDFKSRPEVQNVISQQQKAYEGFRNEFGTDSLPSPEFDKASFENGIADNGIEFTPGKDFPQDFSMSKEFSVTMPDGRTGTFKAVSNTSIDGVNIDTRMDIEGDFGSISREELFNTPEYQEAMKPLQESTLKIAEPTVGQNIEAFTSENLTDLEKLADMPAKDLGYGDSPLTGQMPGNLDMTGDFGNILEKLLKFFQSSSVGKILLIGGGLAIGVAVAKMLINRHQRYLDRMKNRAIYTTNEYAEMLKKNRQAALDRIDKVMKERHGDPSKENQEGKAAASKDSEEKNPEKKEETLKKDIADFIRESAEDGSWTKEGDRAAMIIPEGMIVTDKDGKEYKAGDAIIADINKAKSIDGKTVPAIGTENHAEALTADEFNKRFHPEMTKEQTEDEQGKETEASIEQMQEPYIAEAEQEAEEPAMAPAETELEEPILDGQEEPRKETEDHTASAIATGTKADIASRGDEENPNVYTSENADLPKGSRVEIRMAREYEKGKPVFIADVEYMGTRTVEIDGQKKQEPYLRKGQIICNTDGKSEYNFTDFGAAKGNFKNSKAFSFAQKQIKAEYEKFKSNVIENPFVNKKGWIPMKFFETASGQRAYEKYRIDNGFDRAIPKLNDYVKTDSPALFQTMAKEYEVTLTEPDRDTEILNAATGQKEMVKAGSGILIATDGRGNDTTVSKDDAIRDMKKIGHGDITPDDIRPGMSLQAVVPSDGKEISAIRFPEEQAITMQMPSGEAVRVNEAGKPHDGGDCIIFENDADGRPDMDTARVINGRDFNDHYDTRSEKDPKTIGNAEQEHSDPLIEENGDSAHMAAAKIRPESPENLTDRIFTSGNAKAVYDRESGMVTFSGELTRSDVARIMKNLQADNLKADAVRIGKDTESLTHDALLAFDELSAGRAPSHLIVDGAESNVTDMRTPAHADIPNCFRTIAINDEWAPWLYIGNTNIRDAYCNRVDYIPSAGASGYLGNGIHDVTADPDHVMDLGEGALKISNYSQIADKDRPLSSRFINPASSALARKESTEQDVAIAKRCHDALCREESASHEAKAAEYRMQLAADPAESMLTEEDRADIQKKLDAEDRMAETMKKDMDGFDADHIINENRKAGSRSLALDVKNSDLMCLDNNALENMQVSLAQNEGTNAAHREVQEMLRRDDLDEKTRKALEKFDSEIRLGKIAVMGAKTSAGDYAFFNTGFHGNYSTSRTRDYTDSINKLIDKKNALQEKIAARKEAGLWSENDSDNKRLQDIDRQLRLYTTNDERKEKNTVLGKGAFAYNNGFKVAGIQSEKISQDCYTAYNDGSVLKRVTNRSNIKRLTKDGSGKPSIEKMDRRENSSEKANKRAHLFMTGFKEEMKDMTVFGAIMRIIAALAIISVMGPYLVGKGGRYAWMKTIGGKNRMSLEDLEKKNILNTGSAKDAPLDIEKKITDAQARLLREWSAVSAVDSKNPPEYITDENDQLHIVPAGHDENPELMDSYKNKLAEIERDTEGMKPNEIGARFSSELEQKGKTINDIVRDFKEVSKGTEIMTLDDFIKRYADDGKWADIKDHPEQLMHDIPKNVTVIDQLGILHKAGSSVIASRSEEPGKTRPETDSSKAKHMPVAADPVSKDREKEQKRAERNRKTAESVKGRSQGHDHER